MLSEWAIYVIKFQKDVNSCMFFFVLTSEWGGPK